MRKCVRYVELLAQRSKVKSSRIDGTTSLLFIRCNEDIIVCLLCCIRSVYGPYNEPHRVDEILITHVGTVQIASEPEIRSWKKRSIFFEW